MAVAAFHVPGASARWGGIAPGGNGDLYAVPYRESGDPASAYGRIDPSGPMLSTFGSSPGRNQHVGALFSAGAVWAAGHGPGIQSVMIDPATDTATVFGPATSIEGEFGPLVEHAGLLAANPVRGRRLLLIDPSTVTAKSWPGPIEPVVDDFVRSPGPIGGGWTTLIGSGWTIGTSGSVTPPSGECGATGGAGGSGVGGGGAFSNNNSTWTAGTAPTANRGGGGGAGQGTVKTAHDGAAGVVIIRYRV